MPADLVEKIFDRFYQIANSTSVKLVGTGIGLALVKNIIDLHHGEIKVKSELGKGSTFTIRLALGKEHLHEDQLLFDFRNSEDQSHYQTNLLSIPPVDPILEKKISALEFQEPKELLIVEDNREIAVFIRKIFEADYKVYDAVDGAAGLALAVSRLPDLIISDVMMPIMDGLSFCKKIKEDEKTAHIPVILLTARTSTVFQVEGFESGADAYVTKPFQPKVLKAQVHSLLIAREQLKKYYGKKITLQPTDLDINSLDEQFLSKMMQLVEDQISNDELSREYLAKAMNMSASSLYRKLKALTGQTTNAFIRAVRLKRAAQMMQNTQYNISEIAYQVGFNDLKYFRTCFRDQFGVNPSQYIENQSSINSDLI
jgi:DNA-binding response OmpR family regulator